MKRHFTAILCLTVLALISDSNAFDPCVDYETLDRTLLGSRNEICPKPDNPYNRLCDYRLVPNWYLIPHNGVLQNSCPVNGSCGTDMPVWLNGNLPIESDGIVDMTCCIKILEDCCGDDITIQVKNCSNMIVYYLPSLEYCDSVYCIETDLPCEQTTTTSTTITPVVTTMSATPEVEDDESDDKTRLVVGICFGLGVLVVCIVVGVVRFTLYRKHLFPRLKIECENISSTKKEKYETRSNEEKAPPSNNLNENPTYNETINDNTNPLPQQTEITNQSIPSPSCNGNTLPTYNGNAKMIQNGTPPTYNGTPH